MLLLLISNDVIWFIVHLCCISVLHITFHSESVAKVIYFLYHNQMQSCRCPQKKKVKSQVHLKLNMKLIWASTRYHCLYFWHVYTKEELMEPCHSNMKLCCGTRNWWSTVTLIWNSSVILSCYDLLRFDYFLGEPFWFFLVYSALSNDPLLGKGHI